MKNLKRTRYHTMNSWNNSTAPAYNLKIYNVVNDDLQDRVYELIEAENFWDEMNWLIKEFDEANDYEFQAGFNGRSGGYLVLYKGNKKISEYKSFCQSCGQKNFTSIKETGKICGKCGEEARIDKEFYDFGCFPGQSIEEGEAPAEVLRRFRKLAIDIVKTTENMARNAEIEEIPTGEFKKVLSY